MTDITDIVVTTCERLPLLQRTLGYIWERTATPYRLHVIDDASTGGNAEYLQSLLAAGKVASIHLHKVRVGIPAHLRALEALTSSDPVVFTDDDVLCPRLEPDWLARGLAAMREVADLGVLALNNPQCNPGGHRGLTEPGDPVTFCRNVGGTFAFARRAVLASCRPADGVKSAVKRLCFQAAGRGWRIGYLTHVYCQHIGPVSMRNRSDLSRRLRFEPPLNDETLEPPDEYKG